MVSDLRACDVAVVIDALDNTGKPAGTVLAFDPEDMATSTGMASLHDVRLADVLASARFLGATCEVSRCFGVQVESLGDGTLARGLSEPVATAVEPCARVVIDHVRDLLSSVV